MHGAAFLERLFHTLHFVPLLTDITATLISVALAASCNCISLRCLLLLLLLGKRLLRAHLPRLP